MKTIIFNDVQNFNGSLDLINSRYNRREKKFWNYKKYLPFIVKKVNSLGKFKSENLTLNKVLFYTGRYNSKLIEHLEWSCNQKIREINRLIEKEKQLLNFVSQQKLDNELRRKINQHIESIKEELEAKKKAYNFYIFKQKRNFKGQKDFFEEIRKDELIEVKSLPLKQKDGEVYQKGVDVKIAVDLVYLANIGAYDIAILLSGDTDLIEAVRLVRGLGKKVVVISYHTPKNPKMSSISDLITAGDHFLNLRILTEEEIKEMSDLRDQRKSWQNPKLDHGPSRDAANERL